MDQQHNDKKRQKDKTMFKKKYKKANTWSTRTPLKPYVNSVAPEE
jgi:hypothetical protein